jgi:hypothetical protein
MLKKFKNINLKNNNILKKHFLNILIQKLQGAHKHKA